MEDLVNYGNLERDIEQVRQFYFIFIYLFTGFFFIYVKFWIAPLIWSVGKFDLDTKQDIDYSKGFACYASDYNFCLDGSSKP